MPAFGEKPGVGVESTVPISTAGSVIRSVPGISLELAALDASTFASDGRAQAQRVSAARATIAIDRVGPRQRLYCAMDAIKEMPSRVWCRPCTPLDMSVKDAEQTNSLQLDRLGSEMLRKPDKEFTRLKETNDVSAPAPVG